MGAVPLLALLVASLAFAGTICGPENGGRVMGFDLQQFLLHYCPPAILDLFISLMVSKKRQGHSLSWSLGSRFLSLNKELPPCVSSHSKYFSISYSLLRYNLVQPKDFTPFFKVSCTSLYDLVGSQVNISD